MTKAKQKPKKSEKGKEEPSTSVENKVHVLQEWLSNFHEYFDIWIIWLNTGTSSSDFRFWSVALISFFKVQNVDTVETIVSTQPTEIFQAPQVLPSVRNNSKPWFQTEILSMMWVKCRFLVCIYILCTHSKLGFFYNIAKSTFLGF